MAKNMSEKQYDSTVKALGALAHEEIFVFQTSNENWTLCEIQDCDIERDDIVKIFGKNFTIDLDPRNELGFFVRNNKLSK